MQKPLRLTAIVLLIFLGFGGVYGGWMLVTDPSGGKFQWSLDLLHGTPFRSFLFPGIVLLVSNGLFPLFIALVSMLRKRYAGLLILLQGLVVTGWLTAQLLFNTDFFVPELHLTTYSVGLLLAVSGIFLLRKKSEI